MRTSLLVCATMLMLILAGCSKSPVAIAQQTTAATARLIRVVGGAVLAPAQAEPRPVAISSAVSVMAIE